MVHKFLDSCLSVTNIYENWYFHVALSFLNLHYTLDPCYVVSNVVLHPSHVGHKGYPWGLVHQHFLSFLLLKPLFKHLSRPKFHQHRWMFEYLYFAVYCLSLCLFPVDPNDKIGYTYRVDRRRLLLSKLFQSNHPEDYRFVLTLVFRLANVSYSKLSIGLQQQLLFPFVSWVFFNRSAVRYLHYE